MVQASHQPAVFTGLPVMGVCVLGVCVLGVCVCVLGVVDGETQEGAHVTSADWLVTYAKVFLLKPLDSTYLLIDLSRNSHATDQDTLGVRASLHHQSIQTKVSLLGFSLYMKNIVYKY